MIYLFTNKFFGPPFIRAASRFGRRTGAAITVIFSARKNVQLRGGPMAALRARVARWRESRDPVAEGLRVLIVDDVNAASFVERLRPGDSGIIAGFNQIFGDATIARLEPFVNVHPSLLPYYRGPEPARWCIVNGETSTGFTIHTVTRRIDAGEILFQETLQIDPHDDTAALSARIGALAVPAFEKWLDHIANGTAWERRVIDAAAVYRQLVDYRSFGASEPVRDKR